MHNLCVVLLTAGEQKLGRLTAGERIPSFQCKEKDHTQQFLRAITIASNKLFPPRSHTLWAKSRA